eukprot:jgi/Pico_ML_1/51492/g2516.t1
MAAATDPERNHVLVFGEPGLFKDKLAQLIHENSAYSDEPVVMIQCKNIKPGAPELFGIATTLVCSNRSGEVASS